MSGTLPVVVVVDDCPYILDLYEAVLEDMAEVRGFEGVAEAIPALAAADLVLTDLMMPRISGLELLDHMTAYHEDVPVLMITGAEPGSPELLEALRRGAQVLAKPFGTEKLREMVRAALGANRPVTA